jgi:hypothetical protein
MVAWLATDPTNNPDAPPKPFDMSEYEVVEFVEADRLATVADEAAIAARAANQNGDNYVLNAVLLASVMFFAGVATRVENRNGRAFVIVIGVIGFLAGVAILMVLPILV